ncbi:hypothetical protein LSP03_42180 [Lysinibacillus sphaericus]|nr:hypothetical protein LSP03_42180 [Lysinibacillus sphaericus]
MLNQRFAAFCMYIKYKVFYTFFNSVFYQYNHSVNTYTITIRIRLSLCEPGLFYFAKILKNEQ